MVRKSLEIIRCSQCHYAKWVDDQPICENGRHDRIPSTSAIPEWCPLDDYKEE